MMLILNRNDTCPLVGWQPEKSALSSSFNSDLPCKIISPWEALSGAPEHPALPAAFYLWTPFPALFFNCLTWVIFLTLEVPWEFLLNVISSILGNENSINFQVGFMGPMEGVIAVWVDILVIATLHPSNQYCKTLRHSLAPQWIYSS